MMKEFEHGGNIYQAFRDGVAAADFIDFSANINPLGPPEWLRPHLSSQIEHLTAYPDPDNRHWIDNIADHTGLPDEQIVVGNGSTELLYAILRAVTAKRVLLSVPCYVDYGRAAKVAGKDIAVVPLLKEDLFRLDVKRLAEAIRPGDLVIIASPNNPTGQCSKREVLIELALAFADNLFLIDEAFLDFVKDGASSAGATANMLTLNSMTKFYGVPGLRVGYGTMPADLAVRVRDELPPWTVNSLAQSFAAKALQDGDYQQQSRKNCRLLRQQLVADLQEIPALKIYPSTANFLFIELLQGNSTDFYNYCKQHSVLIRRCDNYQGLDNPEKFVRIAVRTAQENNKLVELFRDHFSPENISKSIKQPKKARSLMFQGTCSDAGKSILTAGLCRILFQDGFKVAPFKAQNMSLNSFVTSHGEEMGRAQVVQAQAARLDPDSRMNPILLKPNSDTGSQIIVSGKPVGNMTVNEYGCYKAEAWQAVCRSYDSLAEEFELIVLEGAGSPGEVNLKHDDIVNMRMAQYAGSPVLLVGDIDRGGVYSSFVGIMEVLAEWERNLVAGYIVNKFRGQASLLESAHRYVTQHTGREVLGVVPYLSNLGLPEEDSVSFKKGSFNTKKDAEGVEIALINLPHISNFTDVEPFLEEPDVSLRVIDSCEQLASPGAIILPGSKNVIHDLQFLLDGGFVEAIINCHKNGAEVVGICGGYQMIGTIIRDPWRIESGSGEIRGLGLLNLETVLEKEKHLTRKNGIHCGSGKTISGYEIHHGISTDTDRDRALLIFDDGSYCGRSDQQGSIWGSYLHGIFDSDDFRRWFIDRLRTKNNLQPIGRVVAPYDLEPAFDRLAEALRQNLDLDKVYKLLGI